MSERLCFDQSSLIHWFVGKVLQGPVGFEYIFTQFEPVADVEDCCPFSTIKVGELFTSFEQSSCPDARSSMILLLKNKKLCIFLWFSQKCQENNARSLYDTKTFFSMHASYFQHQNSTFVAENSVFVDISVILVCCQVIVVWALSNNPVREFIKVFVR